MDQVTERLRGVGLRATATRVAVLGVLDASGDHPRVDQIIERVRSSGVGISTQATYDVCEAPCLDPADAQGFAIDEAEVTCWGLCPTCARVRSAPG